MTIKGKRKTIDSLAYFIGVTGNFAVIPQVIKAWQSKTPGMSVLTWILFVGIGLIWLVYAVIHRQKPLIVAQVVCLLCDSAVVMGWVFTNYLR